MHIRAETNTNNHESTQSFWWYVFFISYTRYIILWGILHKSIKVVKCISINRINLKISTNDSSKIFISIMNTKY